MKPSFKTLLLNSGFSRLPQDGTLNDNLDRIADLERALWIALDGLEVVVTDDTPRKVEIVEREDGGRLVRRAR